MGLMMAVALAYVVGFAVASYHWFNALPERSTQASPFSFVQQDRRSSLVGALAASIVVGVTIASALAVAGLVGEILGQGIAGGLGETGTTSFTVRTDIGTIWSAVSPILVIGMVAVPSVSVFLLVLLTGAWLRFALVRAVLAVRGHLPWRLLTFLADARNRELLRQSGGMYQFRHIRLQERLAARPDFVTPGIRPSAPTATIARKHRRITARVVIIASTMVIASTAITTLSTFNYLRCASPLRLDTDVDQVRLFTPDSLCVGIVPEVEWNRLNPAFDHKVLDQLRKGNKNAKGDKGVTVAIFGPLSTTDLGMCAVILRQLDGVERAQSESELLGRPIHVVLVNTGAEADGESESAAFDRAVSLIDRPDNNIPTVVTLSKSKSSPPDVGDEYYLFGRDFPERIPIFSADIRHDIRSSQNLVDKPLSETRAEFDQQLQDSLISRFVQYTLKTELIPALRDDYFMRVCASAERPVLVYEGQALNEGLAFNEEPELDIGQFLSRAKACGEAGKGHVRVAVEDGLAADDLLQHVPVQEFPNLTVYYPEAVATSATRRCEEIPARVFPSRAGTFADADVAAEFSCQATLNAAGMGNLVVQEKKAHQN